MSKTSRRTIKAGRADDSGGDGQRNAGTFDSPRPSSSSSTPEASEDEGGGPWPQAHGPSDLGLSHPRSLVRPNEFHPGTLKAHVIAMIGSKGGVGRTTVGMLLATTLARRGRRVIVVDADLQGAASTWSWASPTEGVSVVECYSGDEERLATTIQNAQTSCDVVIVDCPSRNEHLSERAARCADVALAPVTPGAQELWAAPRAIALVARVRADHPTLRFAGIINRFRPSRLVRRCVLQFVEMEGLPLLRAQLCDRASYTEASVVGLKDPIAIRETEALAREVLSFFGHRPDGRDIPPLAVRGRALRVP